MKIEKKITITVLYAVAKFEFTLFKPIFAKIEVRDVKTAAKSANKNQFIPKIFYYFLYTVFQKIESKKSYFKNSYKEKSRLCLFDLNLKIFLLNYTKNYHQIKLTLELPPSLLTVLDTSFTIPRAFSLYALLLYGPSHPTSFSSVIVIVNLLLKSLLT